MATSEERMQILKMVQEGKISAEEAADLLEALEDTPLGEKSGVADAYEAAVSSAGKKPRWFRVRVSDTDSGRPRVNVRLPVSMITIGLKMGTKFSPEIEGLNMTEVVRAIEAGEVGQIVDVQDNDDGEHVEVFLE